jgi:hypothetical protein
MELEMWPRWYILENGMVRSASMLEAGKQLADIDSRRVDHTVISDDCVVSSVFLVLDHNFSDEGLPILFETLVFGGPYDGAMWRASALGQAKKIHWEIVDNLRAGEPPNPSLGEEVWVWRMLREMFGEEE